MSLWIHCNKCYSRYAPVCKFFVTDCLHVFCEKCLEKSSKSRRQSPFPKLKTLSQKKPKPVRCATSTNLRRWCCLTTCLHPWNRCSAASREFWTRRTPWPNFKWRTAWICSSRWWGSTISWKSRRWRWIMPWIRWGTRTRSWNRPWFWVGWVGLMCAIL